VRQYAAPPSAATTTNASPVPTVGTADVLRFATRPAAENVSVGAAAETLVAATATRLGVG
jgi:hypothetical protein